MVERTGGGSSNELDFGYFFLSHMLKHMAATAEVLKVLFGILTIAVVAISGAYYGLEPNEKFDEQGDYTTKGKALVWTSWVLLSIWILIIMGLTVGVGR
jgi:hypothetical protein